MPRSVTVVLHFLPPITDCYAHQSGRDTCPECAILEPVHAWPGLDAADVGRSGPCGYNARVGVDYNTPGDVWGKAPVAIYKAGDVIDVQWWYVSLFPLPLDEGLD